MANKNYSKEIAEYEKKIAELKLEEAKENLQPVLDVICDEILRDNDAVNALSGLAKDEVKAVAKVLAGYATVAVDEAAPEIEKIREKRARQSAARKARREAAAADNEVSEEETEANVTVDEEMSEAMTTPSYNANGWNGHSNNYGGNIQ